MGKIGYSEESCELEHEIRMIIDGQQRYGFTFDIPGAESLYETLRRRQQTLGEEIIRLFPPRLVPHKEFVFRTRQDGTEFASYLKHIEKYPDITFNADRSKYTTWEYQEFNLASPKQRTERLLELGWIPQQFTKQSKKHPKGQPKVDEDSLLEAAERLKKPELNAIAEWLVTFGRANYLNDYLKNVNREDSRIHGTVFTCGALSRRARHNKPNTGNPPGPTAKYGKEFRELLKASPGRVLLDWDAKGIQTRMMGHYTDLYNKYPEIYQIYLGKPHQRNADLIGTTYKHAKNLLFAFMFGATDRKLGSMSNKHDDYGAYVRSKLYESCPGLKEATEESQAEFKQNKGRLKCIDGGYVNCPGRHAAFNYRCQPGEAVVMKKAGVYFWKESRRLGLDAPFVGFVHDEFINDCVDEKTAKEAGVLSDECLRNAGEHFNLRVPMGGNWAVGSNWAEVH